MRITLLAVAFALFISVLPVNAQAVMQHYQLNIPRQPLDTALKDFAHQTGLQVARMSDAVDGSAIVGPVSGVLSAEEALKLLLAPSGLNYKMVNERTIAIFKAAGASTQATLSGSGGAALAGEPTPSGSSQDVNKKSASERLRVAQVDQGHAAVAAAVDTASSQESSKRPATLEEVLVTAQKREERLQDVPIPVAVIDTQSLVSMNEVRFQEFYTQVPGLSVSPGVQSSLNIAIRGLTVGTGTTAITIDDVPLGAGGTGTGLVTDLDPGDLSQIEVLRGPQGTLYGANSIGGLIRYVTANPSMERFSGHVEAGASTIYNGADAGYSFRGGVNVPLSSSLALIVSGFVRQEPGYIDNTILGINGINVSHAGGGHIGLLWRPTESLSIKLNALYQKQTGSSTDDVNTPDGLAPWQMNFPTQYQQALANLGPWQQYYIKGSGGYQRQAQVYTAVISGRIGNAELTSVTGYSWTGFHDSYDWSSVLGSYVQGLFGQPGAPIFNDSHTTKMSQELRIKTPLGPQMELLLAGFYTYENSPYSQRVLSTNPLTGAEAGEVLYTSFPGGSVQYAGFGTLTYHITHKFDLLLGGRQSWSKVTNFPQYNSGPGAPLLGCTTSPCTTPEFVTKTNAFTYLVTPQYKFDPDLMLYARLASSYRPGTTNAGLPGVPPQSQPDKTEAYELGLKGDFQDHRIFLDASVYYTRWKNIQIGLVTPPPTDVQYIGNGGEAKSEGVELSGGFNPVQRLRINGWVAWNEAILLSIPPNTSQGSPLYGQEDQPLPWAPRFSGNVSADYSFPLWRAVSGSVGATESYVGSRKDIFLSGGAARRDLPSYARTDVRAGITTQDDWKVTLYATNVTNERGLISGETEGSIPFSLYYIQPRVVGLVVSKSF